VPISAGSRPIQAARRRNSKSGEQKLEIEKRIAVEHMDKVAFAIASLTCLEVRWRGPKLVLIEGRGESPVCPSAAEASSSTFDPRPILRN
jgi:hypothetical protein